MAFLLLLPHATAGAERTVVAKTKERPASEPSSTTPQAALTLQEYLPRFLAADSTWRVAALESTIADLAVQQSDDRLGLDVEASSGTRYDRFIFGTGEAGRNLGTLAVSGIATRYRDRFGGTLTASADGQFLTRPALSSGGHQSGVALDYSLPLLRNAFGRLHDLETRYLRLSHKARQADAQAYLIDRCAAGIDLFVTAYLLQEQVVIWQELLQIKRKTFERTEHDHRRRMISKLDFLAAQSDWILAQQRDAELGARLRRALVSLHSYMEVPTEGSHLETPQAALQTLVIPDESTLADTLSQHPLVKAAVLNAESYNAQADFTERSLEPELAVVPQVGVDYYSRMFQPPGVNAELTDISAMLSLVLTLPVIDRRREYDTQILLERSQQEILRQKEVLRSLVERYWRACETIKEAEARLALTEQKRVVLADQLQEAENRFNTGRLEFQDYLQHWALYEDARFEKLDLLSIKWLSQVEVLRTLGSTIPACQ